jgi:hypothetical protein
VAVSAERLTDSLVGSTTPRIGPPQPAKSRLGAWQAEAADLGIKPMPWQDYAARFMMATGSQGWLYPEVCFVVARQNGKTEILPPRIRDDLKRGRRVLHTAQNRTLPRKVFVRVARSLPPEDIVSIRYANGQETIEMRNGGEYTIVAPQRGARGLSADTVIFDEVREFEDFDIVGAAGPTLMASTDPQIIYLSNAGSIDSVVLNDLRRRGELGQPELGYLEWSAAPELAMDDRTGWAQANPAIGHMPAHLRNLATFYETRKPSEFETEHLCRWVKTMQPRVVNGAQWDACRVDDLTVGLRPFMAISVSPDAKRASVVLAWQQDDGLIALDIVEDIADELDLDSLGIALRERARKAGVVSIGFASWTDTQLARHFPNAKAVDGKEMANASVNFARLIDSGFIRWRGADTISNDLTWLARKAHESGAWTATPIDDEHSVTAALAAIRATWLAAAPKPPAPRIG